MNIVFITHALSLVFSARMLQTRKFAVKDMSRTPGLDKSKLRRLKNVSVWLDVTSLDHTTWTILVSLAEAETIRKAMHSGTLEGVDVSIRMLSDVGEPAFAA